MSPLGEAIDDPTDSDDYVAQLLAKDARDSSLKYSALGMQAYMPRRPTTGAPKPNTRFLKNILRDTDSHNAALKRKEEEEARERMRKLRAEKSSGGSRRRDEHQQRVTMIKKIMIVREGIGGGGRVTTRMIDRGRRGDIGDETMTMSVTVHEDIDNDQRLLVTHRDTHENTIDPLTVNAIYALLILLGLRLVPVRGHPNLQSAGSTGLKIQNKFGKGTSRTQGRVSDDDSDPLDDIIGPLPPGMNQEPPIRTRGRGAYRTNSSNIDAHFASNYDPTLDVQLDDEEAGSTSKSTRRPVAGLMTEEDDWDMALEALRDRAVWKKKGAERLREAGFGDSMVERWTNNTAFSGLGDGEREKDIEDFKWAKKGEGREWDRGKVLTEDGHVDLKAPW
ncbi:predicted protein [Paecilomyces variotii No. 5]|uniref:Uncharacterized protein n=1 Tax=Byssochlamys spectabilis (strain No. 5 / NBRC 109023) TaxID=1356009 RepID=V5F8L1_BYSSN|nr:predicted protein [Paecilomyces variotii No. 5]